MKWLDHNSWRYLSSQGSKIDLLHSQYKNFYVLDNETIDEMLNRFTKITNGLSSLAMRSITTKKWGNSLELFQSLGGQGNNSQGA